MSVEQNSPNFTDYCMELGSFAPSNIERVSNIMERHQKMPPQDFPEVRIFEPPYGKPIEVWDTKPANYNDTLVAYSTSGNPLTPNILFRFMPLAEALPDTRLIVVGSHGGIGKQTGKVAMSQLFATWQGDYTGTVEPVLAYLQAEGIQTSKQQGYSLGAEMPPVAAINGERFDHQVTDMVLIEPTRVGVEEDGEIKPRGKVNLATTLNAADQEVAAYQNAAMSPTYEAAIKQSSPAWIESLHPALKPLAFLRLASLTNLAYFSGQTKPQFEVNMNEAYRMNPELSGTAVWGTESTLAVDALLKSITNGLSEAHGTRSKVLRIPGLTHAFGNHIYLHTLATLQALRPADS